jgi:50S ribosomal protein L16 3-hydroxylase
MDIESPTPMLGGLSPQQFMRKHWQKQALLVRQTGLDYLAEDLSPRDLFALAAQDSIQSRLIQHNPRTGWQLQHGPFDANQPLPSAKSKAPWTVLVQRVDTAHEATHALLQRFAFVPQARLDDVMVSYASAGGGVGPHVDSYDVFLLQLHGQRRWRYGKQADLSLVPDLPLKILERFEPSHEALLSPGDMLYLPPGWGHDGVAEGGDCVTVSIGFRAPSRGELLREMLHRAVDELDDAQADELDAQLGAKLRALYADKQQTATASPGRIPQALQEFAMDSVAKFLVNPMTDVGFGQKNTHLRLGEWLSEPGGHAPEPSGLAHRWPQPLVLAAASRMLYDDTHIFLNGQSWRAGGADAKLMRTLADARGLNTAQLKSASAGAKALLQDWLAQGWLVGTKA